MAAAAAAAGISSLQQVEGCALTSEVGVAGLRQVPGAVHHVRTVRKADLVQIVWRRPPRGKAVQPEAPAPSGSARLAVLGRIPGLRLGRALAPGGSWLFFCLLELGGLRLLMGERCVYFLLLKERLGRRPLFLEGDGFMRGRGVLLLFSRELGMGQYFLLCRDGCPRGRGLRFSLALEGRVMWRGVRVIQEEASGQGWGRGCCVANLLKVLHEVLWSELLLL